jgi:hypothetical protein
MLKIGQMSKRQKKKKEKNAKMQITKQKTKQMEW